MSLTKETVMQALRSVQDPELHRDLISLDAVKKVAVCEGHVSVTVGLPHGNAAAYDAVRRMVVEAVHSQGRTSGDPVSAVAVEFVDGSGRVVSAGHVAAGGGGGSGASTSRENTPQANAGSLPGVRHIVAVGAGKGGVGKSTVSVNLAVGLARRGHAVGLMDGDIYGPSVPTLLGLDDMQATVIGNSLQPFAVHGIKTMTIGKLVDPEKPLIWRGPMAHGAFKQIAEQTQWGELDYLIIDLPPGTGDVSLTMAQLLSMDGAVIVCTPQKVAQDDAVRAARMFQQLGIDVLGVVENMSYFIGDDGKEYDIFGRGGAERMAQRLGVPYLGAVPIHMALRENSDSGNPTANFEGQATLAGELEALTTQFENQVKVASMRRAGRTPTLTVSD
ncbi:MAG: MRP family ATP-binding protein [Phycisphaeraceae bacterium]|nr:MAG: MRP family ATP-binding protein [Phycisphaeraceae bacterium]